MAATLEPEGNAVNADYDPSADTLYLTSGAPLPSESEDGPRGVMLRYAMVDDRPSGATIVGFRRNGWLQDEDELAEIVGHHLHVPSDDVLRALRRAL